MDIEDDLRWFIEGSGIGFVLFLAYLELSPKLGQIWYRIDSDGTMKINLDSALNYLKRPFTSTMVWKPRNWDLNFIMFSTLFGSLYTLIRHQNSYMRKIDSSEWIII